ncbi:MAG TPA: response regulator transcription factor [Micromonosporaceae bacterium]
MTTRLLVVDDHPLLRLGIADVISASDDIELVGDVDRAAARHAIARTKPTVIVVGIHTPVAASLSYAKRLLATGAGVVLLDDSADPAIMLRALDHGYAAYVSNSDTADEIVAAIRHAHVCPGSFAAAGLAAAVRAGIARDSVFSTRERQVLTLLRDGHSSSSIAARLGVSDSSVKTYVTRIYGKLEVSNRSQALVAALGRGLLEAA